MTLYKQKYRYIGLFFSDKFILSESELYETFSPRHVGLFGYIDFVKSSIKIIRLKDLSHNVLILKCRLESLPNILISLTTLYADIIIFATSGTIKKLRKKAKEFVEYILEYDLINR